MKPNESIAREFQLGKEYWLRTIQPYIAGRKLRNIELFVAKDAHLRLHGLKREAEDWNRTPEGQRSPLDIDLSGEEFHEPEILFANEKWTPETLAKIAAPWVHISTAKMGPAEAVHNAHELLMAAERYIETLPERKTGVESVLNDLEWGLGHYIPFAEILRSNKNDSRQLTLLPTAQHGRHAGILSLEALKCAVKKFLKWQSLPDNEIEKCLQNGQILLQTLCLLRWERFKNHWQDQQKRANKRKSIQSKRPKKKKSMASHPHSAASSPTTVGKRSK